MSTSTSENPTFSYPDIGVYPVSLTVSLPNGQTATVRRKVVIFELITTSFTTEGQPCLDVAFTDTSTTTETIISWLWDFGDGDTSTLQNPVHTYLVEDDYDVTLTIRTSAGGIGVITDTITATITDNVIADFGLSDSLGVVTFTDASVTDSSIVSWLWDFGDGIGTSTSQNPVYTYAANGSYDVTLTVTSDCGVTDDYTYNIVLADVPTPIPMLRKTGNNMAVFTSDISPTHAKLHITTNFTSGTPTWSSANIESIFGGTVPTTFTVDPFSPLYNTGSGYVNGWALVSNHIYYVQDIFGTPSASLQYTASGGIGLKTTTPFNKGIVASKVDSGHAMIVAEKNVTAPGCSGIGVGSSVSEKYVLVTTDGGTTWNLSAAISPVDLNPRTVKDFWYSKTNAGVIYVAIQDTTTACALKATLWKSTNDGTTFAHDRDLVVASGNAAANTNYDDSVLFTSYNSANKTYKDSSDITQSESGSDYAASSFDNSLITPNNVVMAANNSTLTGYYYSTNGGSSWTKNYSVLNAAGTAVGLIFMADDDDESVYAYGTKVLWYSPDFATALVGKFGNTGSFESIIGFCQG